MTAPSLPDAARALLAALPKCDRCDQFATHENWSFGEAIYVCPEHEAERYGLKFDDVFSPQWAAPAADLRAALAAQAPEPREVELSILAIRSLVGAPSADDPALVAAVVEAAMASCDADDVLDALDRAVHALRAKRGQR